MSSHQIRVSVIAPGDSENIMQGGIVEHSDPEKQQQGLTSRPCSDEDIRKSYWPSCVWASEASSYVVGTVDEGYTGS